jgi:hypothetical protein
MCRAKWEGGGRRCAGSCSQRVYRGVATLDPKQQEAERARWSSQKFRKRTTDALAGERAAQLSHAAETGQAELRPVDATFARKAAFPFTNEQRRKDIENSTVESLARFAGYDLSGYTSDELEKKLSRVNQIVRRGTADADEALRIVLG